MELSFKKAASFLDRAPELWKENVELIELNRRFLWFLFLRFGVVAALVFLGLAKGLIIPELAISSVDLVTVGLILFLVNIFHWFYYEWATTHHDFPANVRLVAGNVQSQIIIDFLFLGYLVYECGGIESPLIYFFLFHNTLSCLFFSRTVSLSYTVASIIIIVGIFSLTSSGFLPERHFIDPKMSYPPAVSKEFAEYYLAGIVSVYLVAWYLSSTITGSLKLREGELQKKIREMEELAREKSRYLLVTTHELKAPFAAIQSYVNVALDGYAGTISDKLKEILIKIRMRCDLLTNMITEMIQLANITSIKEHGRELAKSEINLSEAVITTVSHLKERAVAKKLRINTGRIAFELHYIEANRQQIDILLTNVISNAILYSYLDTVIEIAMEEKGDKIVVSVKDRGIGIKKEHLEKVFLEHFRTEKAVQVNPNSTGLGLTIARQIMDISDGKIWIESGDGVGTTVFMEFPKAV